jgi:hypothetical protein
VYRIGGRVDAHVGEGTREGFHRGEVGFPVGLSLASASVTCTLKPFLGAFALESVAAKARA